ncbi:MAG TPA: IclR family transcriptional regulator [Candidatus Gemmiger excrementavium]|uniref:Glycerol operon regulatory protein n=1 Tax=Candidatus Gemmiger excrementavium TaxID=2838608 RepID=A0A9D2F378_9FIRM|nr:IclR family transcriptional regulator [Candidatus Gemmiger excrementavium]
MADKGGVQSVERIFALIERLAAHPAGASLQRLAQETELAKSTVHRLLASLVALGYAMQDGETGRYRLTLKMFELSSGIVNSMDIMGVAKAHLERLAQRTGEAVHLVIRDGQDIVYIYKTENGPMRMSSRVGLRSPLYCTGVGKAILATLPPEKVADIWARSHPQKLTDRTVTDLAQLQAQLEGVRVNGYAVDDEENELGVRCVAVAIPGADGRADTAFSISGLTPYMTPERLRRIAAMALDARTDILADLGLLRQN